MKKIILILPCLFLAGGLVAQDVQDDGKVEVITCKEFHVTKPLRELIEQNPMTQDDETIEKKESFDRKFRIPFSKIVNPNAQPQGEDPAMQKTQGTKQLQLPIVSWNGQNGSGTPPDPTGAAGLNYFVQAVNTEYKIYTKTGGNVTGGGSFNLGDLLFGVNAGDPIVLYDKFADRWFISQFGDPWSSNPNDIYIAISQTSDPTGSYYTYTFTMPDFPDYLKFSIWHDGYYMTSNMSSQRIAVFERSVMLTGGTARAIIKTFNPPDDGNFFCPLPADADGQLPPAGTPCPIFSYEDDGWGTGFSDRINIYNMAVSWTGSPTATVTLKNQLNSLPFDASYDSNWDDIVQPGTSQKLDGIGGVFTFRAQHRIWTGFNTVVLNMGVKVSPTCRSVRWYELRQSNISPFNWSIYQQGTYSPDGLNRWCGSIAMDDNGSIGLVYAVSGTTPSNVYPSIRYTGRNANDALGLMTYAEQLGATGTSYQTMTNRFGDYSHTALDPADGTILWHTGEYMSGGQKTKIFSFSIPNPVGIEENQQQTDIKAYKTNDLLMVTVDKLPNNNEMDVDLFDINGRLLEGMHLTPVANSINTSFNVYGFAAGTYLLRIGEANTSFQKVIKVVL